MCQVLSGTIYSRLMAQQISISYEILKKFRDIIFLRLLIAEPIPLATIRALPGNAVARHAPEVFSHAFLANMKAASALPAERRFFFAANTNGYFMSAVLFFKTRFSGWVFHSLFLSKTGQLYENLCSASGSPPRSQLSGNFWVFPLNHEYQYKFSPVSSVCSTAALLF